MFTSNIWHTSAPLRDISFQNLSNIDIDLSRSLRSNVIAPYMLPIHAFLLTFNSNIWPNLAPLRNISFQNLSDLDFDLSMSLKDKCDGAVGLPILICYWRFIVTYGLIQLLYEI